MTVPAIREAIKLWILLLFAPTALSISNLSDSRDSTQTRMLTGKRELCPDGSGSQKFGYIRASPITKFFYAAIKADKDPATAPTFVYFEGGPGGSSVAAPLQLNGPCIRDFVARRLRLNLIDVITKFTQENLSFNRNVHLVGNSYSASFVAMLAARLGESDSPRSLNPRFMSCVSFRRMSDCTCWDSQLGSLFGFPCQCSQCREKMHSFH